MNKILLSDIIKKLVSEYGLQLKWSGGINERGNDIVFSARMFKDYENYDWRLIWKLDPSIEINDHTGEISIYNCEELTVGDDIKVWNIADPNSIPEFIKTLEIYFPKD